MKKEKIKHALHVVASALEAIAQSAGFQEIIRDEDAHPEITSDLADARHYITELLCKIPDIK